MANITQTIPSLTAGISQQPDEQKIPGQVKDLENALPDVTHGLLKRPAGKFVGTLATAEDNGKWFHYYRDENEQYIGQVHRDGAVKMWACTQVKKSDGSVLHEAGAAVNVVDGIGNATYLIHTKDSDIQTLTLNDFTYITNRSINTAMDETSAGLVPVGNFEKELYIELKSISYAKQYGLNLFDNTGSPSDSNYLTTTTTATRISIPSSNLDEESTCPNVGTEIFSVGTEDHVIQDVIQQFEFKNIHSDHQGKANFFENDLNEHYYLFYCPPEWTANTFYRPGDLVTGRPDTNNNNAHRSVYKLKAGSKSDYSKSDGSAPSHTSSEVTVATNNGDGSSTANGHTWIHVSDEIYEADETSFEEPSGNSGAGSGATTQDHHLKPCIKLYKQLQVNSPSAFSSFLQGWRDDSNYSHLPFEIGSSDYGSATANTTQARFYIVWKDYGYYDDHLDRIIIRRPGGTGDWVGNVYVAGHTIGGGKSDRVTGVGEIKVKVTGWSDTDILGAGRKDLYFRITNTGQAIPDGTGDNYSCRYTTTVDLLHGGSGWEVGDKVRVELKGGTHIIQVDAISTSTVRANLGLIRPAPTSFDTKTTVTADTILGDMRNAIIAQSGFTAADVEQIGSGLYIKKAAKFSASTPVKELLNIVASQINDIGDLPSQCKHGMVVEVVNSVADEDNHYVQFHGNGGLDGAGVWEECAKPGRKNRFDYAKMPVALIRTADGNFRLTKLDGSTYGFGTLGANFTSTTANNTVTVLRNNHGFETGDLVHIESDDLTDGQFIITKLNNNEFTYISASNEGNQTLTSCIIGKSYTAPLWEDAIVGDDVTNPEPSFIGKPINKMLFFRNRLALLSEENIILSRPGSFFDFFANSAIQFIPSDPIDLSASSTYPATLYDGIQVNAGLILFTKNQQFMLTTDSDILSVQTAKINSISTYNFNTATNPISLGTTIGFLDNANKHSRFFEMASALREGEPEVIEQSAVVSRLFNNDLKLISNSRENSIIFFSEGDSSTLYGYKYFDQINQRKLASWFKWTVEGTIKYHCMQDDNLFAVVKDAGDNNTPDYHLLKFSLKPEEDTTFTVDGLYDLHLDHMYKIPTGTLANYNTSNGTTSISLPATSGLANHTALTNSSGTSKLFAYNPNSGSLVGTYKQVVSSGTLWLIVEGNWSQGTGGVSIVIPGIVVGFNYTMKVDIPTLYYQKQSGERWVSDTRADTILHRIKLGFGPVGTYETKLKCLGKADYNQVFEVTPTSNPYASGITNDDTLTTIPIYNRNINTSLTIESTHPTPMTLHNLTWEGSYTDKNYSRV